MKKIQKFEDALKSGATLAELGINSTMYWAYRNSVEAESDLIDFSDVIWDEDVKAIAATCLECGITEFTISSTFSSLIPVLATFDASGIKMAGLTTAKTRYTDWSTGEHRVVPAIKMIVGM